MHNNEVTPLLVSIDAAAHMLGISPKTIRNQASRSVFPIQIVKLGGRSLLRLTDIHSWVGGGVPPTSAHQDQDNKKRGRGRPRKESMRARDMLEGGAA